MSSFIIICVSFATSPSHFHLHGICCSHTCSYGLITCVSHINIISPPRLSLNYQNHTRTFQDVIYWEIHWKNMFDYHLISPINQKLQYMYINSVLVAKVAWNLWTTNAHAYGWTKPYRMLKAPTQGEGLGKGTFRWFYPCLFCKEVDTSGDSQ